MWPHVAAITWAQLRTVRNHLPRTGFGTLLLGLLSLLWYGLYAVGAVYLATYLPTVPPHLLRVWLPFGLLIVFIYWQVFPLFTLSTGWSLQLNKLQIYPISTGALFGMEVFLRLTSAPEMVLIMTGAVIGLVRHPMIPWYAPFALVLYIPLNLFLSLSVRDLFLRSFQRNRLREVFAMLLVGIAILPQLFLRTPLGVKAKPYFWLVAKSIFAPWREVAWLSLAAGSYIDLLLLAAWTALCYAFARVEFRKTLMLEESFAASSRTMANDAVPNAARTLSSVWHNWPNRVFRDPLAVLLQKEFQSLLRMPRFRVVFGMACIFSIFVFVPMTMRQGRGSGQNFLAENFLPIVTLYGLLLLSEVLLLNVFGFDRAAAQLYFVTPVPLRTVIRAKNLTAVAFIALQSLAVLFIAAIIRIPVRPVNIVTAVAASAVVCIFFLSVGNLSSVYVARPIDARQTFRKQAGGRMQLWLLSSSVGMFILVGLAFLAGWAFRTPWAVLAVLLLEFLVGLMVYHLATDSAVERAMKDRERIMDALSKGASPVGLGS